MAYWGEAMSHNHPVWMEQDLEAARGCAEQAGAVPRGAPGQGEDGAREGIPGGGRDPLRGRREARARLPLRSRNGEAPRSLP
jgi:hypothetical protein